jgi:ABC-2 type transport system permease protein
VTIAATERGTRRGAAFGLLIWTELKLAWRNPVGLIFGLGLPVLLLVIFGSIPATTRATKEFGGVSFFNVYVPTLMVLVLMVLGLIGLPGPLATYREQGVLRRMSTTPVPPSWLLTAQLAVNLLLAVLGVALVLGVGAGALGLVLPRQPGGFLLSLVLTAGALFGMGLFAAAVAKTAQLATGIGMALFYPLAFLGGVYFPLAGMPATVRDIAEATPSGAAVQALNASLDGRFPGAGDLLVLAAWALVSAVAAVRMFRWE